MTVYYSHGKIESNYCVGCDYNIKYVCNSCNCSNKHLREFKRVQCSIKNQLSCDNPSPSHVLYLEQGSADDTSQNWRGSDAHDYDYSPNHDLNLEHNITDDAS
jgi:hypothetical protein